ncbi:protein kinase [Myxococcota bacterium]|nr:protein kinase [Myxococcota bacterium]MBU1897059.1 protein kinase [Myxococcota bacterium]
MKISVELRRAGRVITLESASTQDTLFSRVSYERHNIHEEARPISEGAPVEAQIEALHQKIKEDLLGGGFDAKIKALPPPAISSGSTSGVFSGPSSSPSGVRRRPNIEAEGVEGASPVIPPAPGEPARICPRCNQRCEPTRQRCPKDGKTLVEDLSDHLIADRYLIKHLIGVGGMDSTVWKAWQTSTERPVALKLQPHPDQSATERFARGARIASNLNHPNITTIYDYGIDQEHLFLAMELLEGQSLHHLLKQLPWLRVERALHITDQILRALQHAHERQIVHRDLKPGNLFLVTHNEDPDFVKIVDFGIAKFATNADEEMAERLGHDVTEQRQICGTPRYMAPEQITMGIVDARTDLYAVGVVLYRMLTGCTPFENANTHELFKAHLRDRPPRFSEVRPSVTIPAAVEAVVFRALAKNPEDRFASAEEMRAALKQIRRREGWIEEHTSTSLTMTSSGILFAPLVENKRRGWAVRLGILAAFFALVGVIVFLYLDRLTHRREAPPPEAPSADLALKRQPTGASVYAGDARLGETPPSPLLAQPHEADAGPKADTGAKAAKPEAVEAKAAKPEAVEPEAAKPEARAKRPRAKASHAKRSASQEKKPEPEPKKARIRLLGKEGGEAEIHKRASTPSKDGGEKRKIRLLDD